MKVVEKLFMNYLQTNSDEYVNKYLAAKAILDITEDIDSKVLLEVLGLRDRIHDRFPISVYKAQMFLRSQDKVIQVQIQDDTWQTYSKAQGHDYLIAEYLGVFLDKVNAAVVKSLAGYNTDRSRKLSNSPSQIET